MNTHVYICVSTYSLYCARKKGLRVAYRDIPWKIKVKNQWQGMQNTNAKMRQELNGLDRGLLFQVSA